MKATKAIQKTINLCLILSAMTIYTYAKAEQTKDVELEKVKTQIIKALNSKNEDMVEDSIDIMEELVEKKYTPQRASFLGSLPAKMATFSTFPWSKIGYANDGSELLDKAILNAPNNLQTRINRLSTYINFPAMLKKAHLVQIDARWILKELKTNNIPKSSLDNIYKALAMFFAKQKDEKRYQQYFKELKNEKYKNDVLEFVKNINKDEN